MVSVVTLYNDNDRHLLDDMISTIPKSWEVVLVRTVIKDGADYELTNIIGKDNVITADLEFMPRWRNDLQFDKARNLASELATRKWIFHLDSDERLYLHHAKMLIPFLESLEDDIKAVQSNIANFVEVNGTREYQITRQTKIYRNFEDIRWESCIHERFDYNVFKNGGKIICSPLLIHHIGYEISDDYFMQKLERNIRGLASQDMTFETDLINLLERDINIYTTIKRRNNGT